ncbi:MAG: hypothetical protein OEU63_07160 [Gammaproteobacteria bacterium]|nr:hypothetical protein [Gammaproteobacteria bacterium]
MRGSPQQPEDSCSLPLAQFQSGVTREGWKGLHGIHGSMCTA